jgi:hypothetical protein
MIPGISGERTGIASVGTIGQPPGLSRQNRRKECGQKKRGRAKKIEFHVYGLFEKIRPPEDARRASVKFDEPHWIPQIGKRSSPKSGLKATPKKEALAIPEESQRLLGWTAVIYFFFFA